MLKTVFPKSKTTLRHKIRLKYAQLKITLELSSQFSLFLRWLLKLIFSLKISLDRKKGRYWKQLFQRWQKRISRDSKSISNISPHAGKKNNQPKKIPQHLTCHYSAIAFCADLSQSAQQKLGCALKIIVLSSEVAQDSGDCLLATNVRDKKSDIQILFNWRKGWHSRYLGWICENILINIFKDLWLLSGKYV